MKYFLNNCWVNDSTVAVAPSGAMVLTDSEWDARQSTPFIQPWSGVKTELLDTIRATREKIIIRLMDIGTEYGWAGDAAGRDACRAARVKLLNMTSRADVVAASNEAELKAAIKAAYADAVGTLPLAALTAFKGVDV